MGVAEFVAAFNEAGDGNVQCHAATLGYTQKNNNEWQVLTFSGTWATGKPFKTEIMLPPKANVIEAARAKAKAMIDEAAQAEQPKEPTT